MPASPASLRSAKIPRVDREHCRQHLVPSGAFYCFVHRLLKFLDGITAPSKRRSPRDRSLRGDAETRG